jgi:uncharacterized protein YcgL (UPF0745 family)
MTTDEREELKKISLTDTYKMGSLLRNFLDTVVIEEKPRTSAQNRALHLWLTQVAQELDSQGFTLQNVVGKIQKAEIRPNGKNLKEVLWKPYMVAALGKDSTTKLSKGDVDRVYEGLNKFLGENFFIHIPFPEEQGEQGVRLTQMSKLHDTNYPEYTGAPTI